MECKIFAEEEQQRSVRGNVAHSATFLSEAKFGATWRSEYFMESPNALGIEGFYGSS